MAETSSLDDVMIRELRVDSPSTLLAAATTVPSVWTRRRRSTQPVAVLAAVAAVALVALIARFGLGPSSGAASSHLAVPAGELTLQVVEGMTAISLTTEGQSSELASVAGGADRLFVAQLVCGPTEGVPATILFGFVGPGEDPIVAGLEAGQRSVGGDGTFLYALDASPSPGNVWTVTTSRGAFTGPMAVWGTTDAPGPPGPPTCVAFDPSSAPDKP
jgi:hypothetical protein